MADVGRIEAQLVADTAQFIGPMQEAQAEVSRLEGTLGGLRSGLDQVAAVGRTAGIALGALTAAVGAATVEATRFGTEMVRMRDMTGFAIDTLQELQAAAVIFNIDVRTLTRTLGSFSRRLLDSSGEASAMVDVMEDLGIRVFDTAGEFRDMEELFFDTVEALSAVESETRRTALATSILGRAGIQMLPIIRAGGDELAEVRQLAHDLGIVMDTETVEAFENLGDAIGLTRLRIATISRTLVADFQPAIEVVIDWVNRAIDLFMALDDETRRQVVVWTGLIAIMLAAITVIGTVAAILSLAIGGFIALGSALAAVWGLVTGLVSVPFALLIAKIAAIAAVVLFLYTVWEENWWGMRDIITAVWEAVTETIATATQTISDAVQSLLLRILEWWEEDGSRIVDTARGVWAAVVSAVNEQLDLTIAAAGQFFQNVIELWQEHSEEVGEWAWEAWGTVEDIVVLVLDEITSILEDFIRTAGLIFETLADVVGTAVRIAMGVVEGIIRVAIANITGDWEAGLEAINDTIELVFGEVEDFILRTLDRILEFFGTNREQVIAIYEDLRDRVIGIFRGLRERIEGLIPEVRLPFGLGAGGLGGLFGNPLDVEANLIVNEVIGNVLDVEANLRVVEIEGNPIDVDAIVGSLPEVMTGTFSQIVSLIGQLVAELLQLVFGEETLERMREFVGRIGGEIGRFTDALSAGRETAREVESELGEMAEELTLLQRAVRWLRDTFDEAVPALREALIENLGQARDHLLQFAAGIAQTLSPLGLVQMLLQELQPAISALISPILLVAVALADALMPVLEALFPVFRLLGTVLMEVAIIASQVWNGLVEFVAAIFDAIESIPLIGRAVRGAAASIRRLKVDTDALTDAQGALRDLTWETALAHDGNARAILDHTRSVSDATEEADRLGQALRGVPEGFRIMARRFETAAFGPAFVPNGPGGNSSPALAGGGSSNPSLNINVNFNAPVYGDEDFRDKVFAAVAEAERRARLSGTGTSVSALQS